MNSKVAEILKFFSIALMVFQILMMIGCIFLIIFVGNEVIGVSFSIYFLFLLIFWFITKSYYKIEQYTLKSIIALIILYFMTFAPMVPAVMIFLTLLKD